MNEVIKLEVDDEDVQRAKARSNKALESIEGQGRKTAQAVGKVFDDTGSAGIRIIDNSARSINRLVTDFEKKNRSIGASAVEKMAAQRDSVLKRIGGDPRAAAQVHDAHALGLRRLAEAQRAATQGNESFSGSVVNLAGKLGLTLGAVELLRKSIGGLADAAIYAAKTETLSVALEAVAASSKLSITELRQQEKQILSLGIGVTEARQALLQLSAAQLDTSKASKLARLAQDAAVIAQTNSSDALLKLVHGIRSGQTDVLRTIGLNVSFERSYAAVAKQLKKNVTDLTEHEKVTARMNATLAEGPSIAGTYERAMGSTGKALGSLERFTNNARLAIGREFQGELTAAVLLLTKLAEGAEKAARFIALLTKAGAGNILLPGGGALLAGAGELGRDRGAESAATKERDRLDALRDANRKLFAESDAIQVKNDAARDVAAKKSEELQKKITAAMKDARNDLQQAQIAELTGLDKINAQHDLKISRLREEVGRVDSIVALRERERDILLAIEQRKLTRTIEKELPELAAKARESSTLFNIGEEVRIAGEMSRIQDEIQRAADERTLNSIETRRTAELLAIEETTSSDVRSKVAAAERVFEVERQYAIELLRLRAELLDRETAARVHAARTAAEADAEVRLGAARAAVLEGDIQGRIDAAQQAATVQKFQLLRDENQRLFDSIRQSADSLFDAMLGGARSFGDALKRIMISALLTPVKQAFSNAVATMLTGLQTAQASAAGTGGTSTGGLFGRLGLGALFGGGGFSLPGAPGGTPGFSGPVSLGGTGRGIFSPLSLPLGGLPGFGLSGAPGGTTGINGPVGGGGSAAQTAGFAAQFAGLKKSLTQLGNIGFKAGGKGVGGAAGGGLLLGGGALAFDGLRRGGKIGLAQTTAGGALIGFKFGGPLGAAIGAGVGFGAGLTRLFIKNAEQKIVEKVQSIYGIKIERNFAKDPLLQIIKSQFGGNIEVGLRSPQIMELLKLYGMSTGQPLTGALAPRVVPSFFSQRGGMLTQAPVFSNGQQLIASRTVPAVSSFQAGNTAVVERLQEQLEVSQTNVIGGLEKLASGIGTTGIPSIEARFETGVIEAKQKRFEGERTAAIEMVQERFQTENTAVMSGLEKQIDSAQEKAVASIKRASAAWDSSKFERYFRSAGFTEEKIASITGNVRGAIDTALPGSTRHGGVFSNAALTLPRTVSVAPLSPPASVSSQAMVTEVAGQIADGIMQALQKQPVSFNGANISLSVNGKSAADALEGRIAPVIAKSPGAVQAAVNHARRTRMSGARRSDMPGIITGSSGAGGTEGKIVSAWNQTTHGVVPYFAKEE